MTATIYSTPRLSEINYERIFHLVQQLLAGNKATATLPLLAGMLGHPLLLCKLLRAALQDDQWMNTIQQASYYHKNGFDKLVLLQDTDFKIRLHWFHAQASVPPAENVHDHRWPFASKIVRGKLRMDMLEVADNGTIPSMAYRYHSQKTNGQYKTDFLGPACLQVKEQLLFTEGKQYYMPTTELHRIVYQPGEEAMTLMVTGKPERSTCQLYASRALKEEDKRTIRYSMQTLRQKFEDIIESLSITHL